MGSSQSRVPATERSSSRGSDTGTGQVEPDMLNLAPSSALPSELLAMPNEKVIYMALGSVMSQICPEIQEFLKCYPKHKLSPEQAVQPGSPCLPLHKQFLRCLDEKNAPD
eukprot:RCo020631